MAKTKITLPNGTEVLVEGNPEEIAKILSLYSTKEQGPRTRYRFTAADSSALTYAE